MNPNTNRILKAFANLKNRPLVIGALHLKSLPGTPLNKYSVREITEQAVSEAEVYTKNGIDAIIIENTNDLPYTKANRIDSVVPASMAVIGATLRSLYPSLPIGIQILAGANIESLSVAKASGLDFIRAEGYIFGHVADEGWMDACAGDLLRHRRYIAADSEAEHVCIFSDIKKKHCSHSVTSDVSLVETAAAAQFFLSDGVIITGSATGMEANIRDLNDIVSSECSLPILVGSGISLTNWRNYYTASGFIVGSYFKKTGHWSSDLDPSKVKEFMQEVKTLE